VIVWSDAQISPQLARWIEETFTVKCLHVRDLGLRNTEDSEIFQKARDAGSVIMTKDEDFVRLVERNGPPPQVIWVTCGNMPNARFKTVLQKTFPDAMSLIASGETVVEIFHER
jgi:predicted nuclease of predicted toxin-antitoxin system